MTALLWGWQIAQYPYLLEPNVTIDDAAANPAALSAMLLALGLGAVLLVPSLLWLYLVSQRQRPGSLG